MPDFANWPLWGNALLFLASAAVVWAAGSRLAGYVDGVATRTGIGQGFAGLVLLGGITSLPEVAVSATAAYAGHDALAVNNLLGSVALQATILAIADLAIGRDALTSVVGQVVVMLQGTFGIILLAVVAVAVTVGDTAIGPVGAWSSFLLVAYLAMVALLAKSEKSPPGWTVHRAANQPDEAPPEPDEPAEQRPLSRLVWLTTAAAAAILAAGWALSETGAAAAEQTGLGGGFFGATVLAAATSLPEVSTILGAMRLRRYAMALGDIFGTNLFNIALIFMIDAIATGTPVLGRVGGFAAVGALMGAIITAIFLAGLIERRDKTVLRMGWDSLAALVCYGGGVGLLWVMRGQTGG